MQDLIVTSVFVAGFIIGLLITNVESRLLTIGFLSVVYGSILILFYISYML